MIEEEESLVPADAGHGHQPAGRRGRRGQERGPIELISGTDAFELYDTYGFPIDLTELIAREQDVEVDLSAFETELQAQKERSRNAAAVATDDWAGVVPARAERVRRATTR